MWRSWILYQCLVYSKALRTRYIPISTFHFLAWLDMDNTNVVFYRRGKQNLELVLRDTLAFGVAHKICNGVIFFMIFIGMKSQTGSQFLQLNKRMTIHLFNVVCEVTYQTNWGNHLWQCRKQLKIPESHFYIEGLVSSWWQMIIFITLPLLPFRRVSEIWDLSTDPSRVAPVTSEFNPHTNVNL